MAEEMYEQLRKELRLQAKYIRNLEAEIRHLKEYMDKTFISKEVIADHRAYINDLDCNAPEGKE